MLFCTFLVKRTDFFSQRIGEVEEEGKGGQIRATLLSNRATTLLKVSNNTKSYFILFISEMFS